MNTSSVTNIYTSICAKEVYIELRCWLSQEHTLISNRLGWLITSSGFLFAALALTYQGNAPDSLTKVIPIAGLVFSFICLALILLACRAIINIRKRIRLLMLDLGNQDLNILNPDFNVEFEDDGFRRVIVRRRLVATHRISDALTILFPLGITGVWLYFSLQSFCILS